MKLHEFDVLPIEGWNEQFKAISSLPTEHVVDGVNQLRDVLLDEISIIVADSEEEIIDEKGNSYTWDKEEKKVVYMHCGLSVYLDSLSVATLLTIVERLDKAIRKAKIDHKEVMCKNIVVGFPCETYSKNVLGSMTDHQKHEWALNDEDCVIYDSLNDFFNEMNDDLVDTENMYWFSIKI